jgi:hypothetical protein
VRATEVIEQLERDVAEFGDGDVQVPDPLESWWYSVDRIEREPGTNAYRFVSDH